MYDIIVIGGGPAGLSLTIYSTPNGNEASHFRMAMVQQAGGLLLLLMYGTIRGAMAGINA